MTNPDCIRIFVAGNTKWAQHEPVLEYSIRKHSSLPVEVTFVYPNKYGMQETGCTSFTNVRWSVPELAGRHGFAVYLDIDMLLVSDIADLYEYRRHGCFSCLTDGSSEVMVMDCTISMPAKETLHNYPKWTLHSMAQQFMRPVIPLDWNCKDEVCDGMRLLHFTDLRRQPWFTPERDDEAVRLLKQYEKESVFQPA